MDYNAFIATKTHLSGEYGFDPIFMPDMLFDFQKSLVEWACRKGRAALFEDCGMGKTLQQLTWAENIVRKTNKRVLIVTPLAVAHQTIKEAEKIGVEVNRSNDGKPHGMITVTNYEKLHLFDSTDYDGAVYDESSIIKHNGGATQKLVTRFSNKMKYRLLCTATASPNDWPELGTSSEALGELSYSDMLTKYFRQLDDKGQKKAMRQQKEAEKQVKNHYMKLAFRVSQSIGQWRLKNHAIDDFWKWVASWARACRMPSDLGFDNNGFELPSLIERDHIISPPPPEGALFNLPAIGLKEERVERKRTLRERCEFASSLVSHEDPAVIWCHYNPEGDLLEKLIPDAVQVAGKTPDEKKEEIYEAFSNGDIRVLVIKPKIGAWGLNWQHCNHVVTFASHSYEQDYQATRRCYRFGQRRDVIKDTIATEGEKRVLANMRRKSMQAEIMFEKLIRFMNESVKVRDSNKFMINMEVPTW